jgi:hypothetical protein
MAVALALAVATPFAAPLDAQPAREILVRLPEVRDLIRLDTLGRTIGVSASPALAYTALEQAHEELGIPRSTADRARREIGHLALPVRRELARERASRSLDCGRGLTGEYADQYRLTVALLTWVAEVPGRPDSSTLHTALVAGGRATDGTRAWPMLCNSLGRLEARLAARVRELANTLASTRPPGR